MGWFGKKGTIVKDPICGMEIDPKSAFGSAEHDGERFYFCSQNCLETFNKNPHKYAHGH